MKFRPSLWSTVFSLLGLVLLIFLGTWQAQRFVSKKGFEEARDAQIELPPLLQQSPEAIASGELDFRQISIDGYWHRDHLFLIKHRVYRGQPGFWVITALEFSDQQEGPLLLVNQGWIPFGDGQAKADEILADLPKGQVTVHGLIHVLEYVVPDRRLRARHLEGELPTGVVEVDSYDTEAILMLLQRKSFDRPLVLTMGPESEDEQLPLASFGHITEPYLTSDTHFGYALTWYVLAIALIAIWVAQGLGLLQSRSFDTPPSRS